MGLPNYARIAWEKALKDSKREAIYDHVLAKFDVVWFGNGLIYHRSNDNVVWHIRVPNVGLVSHV